jgi:hypothetical protein
MTLRGITREGNPMNTVAAQLYKVDEELLRHISPGKGPDHNDNDGPDVTGDREPRKPLPGLGGAAIELARD